MASRSRSLGPHDFGAGPVQVLLELDAVRKRPRMYVGDTDDGTGLHNMVYAVVEHAIAESRADLITVTLDADGSVTVSDNGYGIPTAIDRAEGISQAEILLTRLSAGQASTHGQASIHDSNARNRISIAMVNALSQWLHVRIWQGGHEHAMTFFHGDPVAPLRIVGPAVDRYGSTVTFAPAPGAFTGLIFDHAVLEAGLRDRAARNPGSRITLADARGRTS